MSILLSPTPVASKIVDFLIEIGLAVKISSINRNTFLPGIDFEKGAIVIDEAKLKYPGDLLHEAGHLAVLPPAQRKTVNGDITPEQTYDGGGELMALAWSYAAAVYLNLDPSIIFHPDGYKGESEVLIDHFTSSPFMGVPGLQWLGLTAQEKLAAELNIPPFPNMLKWLCDEVPS